MPELPEVETIVRDLRPRLVGRVLVLARVSRQPLRRPWVKGWTKQLQGQRVAALRRRGKWIVVELQGDLVLVIHLGMTGQLTVVPGGQPVAPHTHLTFDLDDGQEQLRFRDVRRFGSATLFSGNDELEAFFTAAGLGPEPFDVDPTYWRSQLAATRRNLKALLLDQRLVAGVGNIYADEALFEAKLHPTLPGRTLTSAQGTRLREAVAAVLTRAIEKRGSSIRDYVGGGGERGDYQREFRVYGQFKKPCPRCQRPIARIRLAGRATHFCPGCQKARRTSVGTKK